MDEQRQRAIELIRRAYENAAAVNARTRLRFPHGPYRDQQELVRSLLAGAGESSTFAVNMGLITPDDAAKIIRHFFEAHPELAGEGDES
jgi:hypothetical protein